MTDRTAELAERFARVRAFTEQLCAPLEPEDYVVQSMPDASPTKWHLAHTTWFFETFVLAPHAGDASYREDWNYLHNSYYEAVGPRHPRPRRGVLTRPTVSEVYAYRAHVNERVRAFLGSAGAENAQALDTLELGLQHEQQHQELILTDLQHALAENPLAPAIHPVPERRASAATRGDSWPSEWVEHPGGLVGIGATEGFSFDNERPPHRTHLVPYAVAASPVTCGAYAEFIADGGYERPELWLSDGFRTVRENGWAAPLYWERAGGAWQRYSLHGKVAVDPDTPVSHVSYYEADAYARYRGARLPTEAEWEVLARERTGGGQFVEDGWYVPVAAKGAGFLGGVWCWTASPYVAYPGYAPETGALGEYNGKFMINQMVLRGGSHFTSRDHVRPTYRNFFPPETRFQASGIRLARSL